MAHYNDSEEDHEDEAAVGSLVDGVISSPYNTGVAEDLPFEDVSVDEDAQPKPIDAATMTARAYQREMLEESLKQNTIVAMDTGSGKTQVAVLRIMAELERASPEKRIWFLAPTVSLCTQQFDVLSKQIPAVQSRFLSGADNIDAWSDSNTWDAVLMNVRIVVSTYQILLDALSHAFVPLESLALIVIDEAHNCSKNNPGSRVMRDFYWPAKRQGREIPHILGLTASPYVQSNLRGLEELEETLDAVCRSPNKHREELLSHVNRPSLYTWSYKPQPMPSPPDEYTRNMLNLQRAYEGLDIATDPYVLQLKSENTDRSRRKLERALMKRDTPIQTQMRSFCRRSAEMCRDLGQWAADWYIPEVKRRFLFGMRNQEFDSEKWNDFEARYLAGILRGINAVMPRALNSAGTGLSDKVQQLIHILVSFSEDNARGIIFVKERATTAVLSHILSTHPEVSRRYRIGTMVGTSTMPGRRQDFLDLSHTDYLKSLENFRLGRTNLLVATSVLEEGIDVPACNLVVCMDKPANPKSFIQRRGRARMRTSRLYILLEENESATDWEAYEEEMKRHYEDEMRELREIESIEDSEAPDFPDFVVPSTNARLSIDGAKSHLEHFCATLSSRRYVDWSPDYIIHKVGDSELLGVQVMLTAVVLLPVCLPPDLREFRSSMPWRSEKNATKDAAFQAYVALYHAGFVNDHLVPLRESDLAKDDTRPGVMTVNEQLNPWHHIAHAWVSSEADLYRRTLHLVDGNGALLCQLELSLPVPIPDVRPVVLYWDSKTAWTLSLGPDVTMAGTQESPEVHESNSTVDHTSVLLALAYGHRWEVKDSSCVIRLVARDVRLSLAQIASHDFDIDKPEEEKQQYLVRDIFNTPYLYQSWIPAKPPIESVKEVYRGFEDSPEDSPYLVVKKWPKKTGFFHPQQQPQVEAKTTNMYPRVLPAFETKADSLPLVYAQVGLLLPPIIHYLEVYLVAQSLLSSKLGAIGISDLSLVATAISASSAREPTNYERIEFLGDSLLKLFTTVRVSAAHPYWPEGLLSLRKDKIVSNSRLCRASVERGLDQFIITRQLRLDKWRPPYIDDLLREPPGVANAPKRELSTKTLADVVEALIGASWIDGDFPAALKCTALFIPEAEWNPLEDDRETLFSLAMPDTTLPPTLQPVEDIIGYTFQRKSLLVEAMTHASYNVGRAVTCLDRLEFLGDAILDHVVVTELIKKPELAHFDMHLLRTALVNGDILGFLVMEWSTTQKRFDAVVTGGSGAGDRGGSAEGATTTLVESETTLPLWSFMRHSSSELALEQQATVRRHAEMRDELFSAIWEGRRYPWAQMARLRVPKFFSDIFESLVGAVWVDSGSLAECQALVERAGILRYMDRILADGVHVLHPKEELGRVADKESVEYVVESVMSEVEGEEDRGGGGRNGSGRTFSCKVLLGKGKRVVAEVGGALYREEAKTLAAMEAIQALKAAKEGAQS